MSDERGPLHGLRVLDLTEHMAGPFCTMVLADMGAEVIKVELPGRGDSLRQMGPMFEGHSLRWSVTGRNKRSITADLHTPEGQQIVRDFVAVSDVLVENYRAGTVAKWGLGYEQLREVNRGLVMLSLSGYGQTGPKRQKPGFGRVIEAVSGIMHVTGEPDGPPTQMGVPFVDYIAGTFGAMGVAMALYHREASPEHEGQWIDLSLYETMVRLSDAMTSRYDKLGVVPMRTGNRYANVAPSDVYRTRDGRYVFHSSATQTVFERLMRAIGREDLVAHPDFRTNAVRTKRVDEMNDIVQDWFSRHDFEDAIRILEAHDVPVGPVNTAAEVLADEQLLERDSIIQIDDPIVGSLRVPGLVPKFSRTPGRLDHLGPAIGEHTGEILTGLLGYSSDRVRDLRERGIV
jgi:formyl-CoA transferase